MYKKRVFLLMGLFLLVFTFLILRLFYFQIYKGPRISQGAIRAHSQGIEMREFSRGEILDRYLVPLTDSRSVPGLYCLPQGLQKNQSGDRGPDIADFLAANLDGLDENKINEKIRQAQKNGTAIIRLKSDLSPAEVERIQSACLPGLVVAPVYKRYRADGFMAHLLGYTEGEGTGLENAYNSILNQGGSGRELIAFSDARGKGIPGIGLKVRSESVPRNAVVLTIDKRIQELVEKVMNQRVAKGAVVVMDIKSKEILAMASRPTYQQERVNEYLTDLDSPLINRALTPYYPGSVFKIMLSLAALKEGVVQPDEKFNCAGEYVFNDQVSISCWKQEGHGELTFAQAFANSCNPTFIKVGLRLGRSRLLEYAGTLHLNDRRVRGLEKVQSDSCVQINAGEAALGNACLGQQGVMLTPLQIAALVATVADDGWWAPPAILKYTLDGKGHKRLLPAFEPQKVIDTATAREVQRMMVKVTEEGTGKTASLPDVKVAGKTATSQTGKINENGDEVLNTWFAGYLPAESPHWAIVVLAEEGKSGAQNCAPVFKDISQGLLGMSP